ISRRIGHRWGPLNRYGCNPFGCNLGVSTNPLVMRESLSFDAPNLRREPVRPAIILRIAMNLWPRGLILTVAYIPIAIDQDPPPTRQRQLPPPPSACPPTVAELNLQLPHHLAAIIAACLSDPVPPSFLEFENPLWDPLPARGRLLTQLSPRARHDRLDLT